MAFDQHLGTLRLLSTPRFVGDSPAAAPATAAELSAGDFPRGPADLGEHLTVLRHLIELRPAGRSVTAGWRP